MVIQKLMYIFYDNCLPIQQSFLCTDLSMQMKTEQDAADHTALQCWTKE